VVTGVASQRPLASFTYEHKLAHWLRSRRGTSMLTLYEFEPDTDRPPVVLCIHCVMKRN
jgi:hypothetical protein